MELTKFREAIQEYNRFIGKSQKDLAVAVGLHPNVLSTKLNGSGNDRLTYPEIKRIIATLISWKAISARTEVLELLALVHLKETALTLDEWNNSPFNQLETSANGHNLPQTDSLPRQVAANSVAKIVPKERTPNNLPYQLTSFIGREKEIAEIRGILAISRLVTLTGAGGSGKTRLALKVAGEVVGDYKDGVWLVELAQLTDDRFVARNVAQILGLSEDPSISYTNRLIDYLGKMDLLLILDNCEHLIEACATLASELLQNCPHLKILATSREGLNLRGEKIYLVPTLGVPPSSNKIKPLNSPENLTKYESVQLFIERAGAVNGQFKLTDNNGYAVTEICRRLDGIPLALELAAVRVKTLSVDQLVERLKDRFHLLTGGSRTDLPRQQTLHALINWSYDLLNGKEQLLLQRLSIFVGGWRLEAAEQVCDGEGIASQEVLDLLQELVHKSLVITQIQEGLPRYYMLESILQFGREKLQSSGGYQELREKYLEYYTCLAEELEVKRIGKEQVTALRLFEKEYNNFEEALRLALDSGQVELELRIAGALLWFWVYFGYISEGSDWVEKGLAETSARVALPVKANAYYSVGWLAGFQIANWEKSQKYNSKALILYTQLGDESGQAFCIGLSGMLSFHRQDYAEAEKLIRDGLAIFRRIGDKWGSRHLLGMSYVLFYQGKFEEADKWLEEALSICQEIGDKEGASWILSQKGLLAKVQNNLKKAEGYFEESLIFARELGLNSLEMSISLEGLGAIRMMQGNLEVARLLLEESLVLREKLGSRSVVLNPIILLGKTVLAQKEYDFALELFKEALISGQKAGQTLQIIQSLKGLAKVLAALGRNEVAARLGGSGEALEGKNLSIEILEQNQDIFIEFSYSSHFGPSDNPVYARAWAEGKALTLEEVVEFVSTDISSPNLAVNKPS